MITNKSKKVKKLPQQNVLEGDFSHTKSLGTKCGVVGLYLTLTMTITLIELIDLQLDC